MSYDQIAIELHKIQKNYRIYTKPIDRLFQMLPWNKHKKLYSEFHALKDISFTLKKGEVLGVVGQNGAGKSTLLQIVCQTLQSTSGSLNVDGKIAALLELGSGFNPEFSGKENVYMAGAIAGLSKSEIDQKYEQIVSFSGIGDHINNPVKTYSSGMMVRLAFSVATSVEPDILIIDEALSVGDGAFAKKSFDRIMELKNSGATILFCSHNLYQVEVLCNKVIWIDHGKIQSFGEPKESIGAYQKYLDIKEEQERSKHTNETTKIIPNTSNARIKDIQVYTDDGQKGDLKIESCQRDITIKVAFTTGFEDAMPCIGILITDENLKNITSTISTHDGVVLTQDTNGVSKVQLDFPKIALMRGSYYLHIFLMCKDAIHIYESVQYSHIEVTQKHSEPGVVFLPRQWKVL